MTIFTNRKRIFSLSAVVVFLSTQILPSLAQAVFVPPHVHMIMPPVMPMHQHTWQINPSSSTNNALPSGQPSNHHFFHHWHNLDSPSTNNSAASNTSQNNSQANHNQFQFVRQSTQLWSNLSLNNSAQSMNLDLSSTNSNMSAGHILHGQSIYINIGGSQLVVTSDTKLTPAEFLAVRQVQYTGTQALVLNSEGNASGGSVVIGQHLSQLISNLIIPQGVTVIDLTKSGTLNLNGNIVDNGSLYIGSRNPLLSGIVIDANNISVQVHGIFSDVIPAGIVTSLNNSRTNFDTNLNLSLNSLNDIVNAGTITSNGSISLNSSTGSITNTGLIQSTNNNINISISSPIAGNDININATGGTFQALNGNINVREANYTGSGNITINGGSYLSQNVNLYSGTGSINGSVGQITGQLNSYAGTEHFLANTDNLVLGNNSVTGDPLYANTGNIEIDGAINTTNNSLAVIAGGNIVSGTGGSVANIVTGTGKVWLIAGADITASSGSTTSPITNGATSLTGVTFQFDSTKGGNIDFTPATSSIVISTTGGSVTLLANSNSSTTGNIWFPTSTTSVSTINPSGGGGAVLTVAGGSGGTSLSGAISQAIQLGQIQTAGTTTTATGNVQLATATPSITNGGGSASFTNPSNSATTTATFGAGAITGTAQLTVGNVITVGYGGSGANGGVAGGAGGNINIQSGSTLQTGNLLSYGGGGEGGYFYGTGSGPSGGNGGNAGTITVISHNGNLTISGETNASGGGGGGGSGTNGGNGGSQANIILSAPVGSVTAGNVFSYAGGAGGAGALVDAGGGGGSFGGGGGGSGVFDNGGDGGAGGGAGAASGGGGGVGAGVGNFAPGNGGGFNGGGAGGAGITASGGPGSAALNLTYGSGHTGGSGGNSIGSGGAPSGSGSTQLANGGGAGTDGDEDGFAAGHGSSTGGVLTVNYFSSHTLGTQVVASTSLNQTVTLTSLDLTQTAVQTEITNLISLGVYGISGTFSNLTIDAGISSNALTLNSLTAFNVPNGDTLALTSFTTGSPTIGVNITNTSTSNEVIVSGAVSFSNSNASIGNFNITSTQVAPAFLVNSTGTLSSDNTLTITAPSIQNSGAINASFSLNATASTGNISGSGTYATNTGTIISGSSIILNSTNGSITTGAISTDITSLGSSAVAGSVTMTANGNISIGGTLDTATNGTGAGGNINLTSTIGSVTTGTINAFVSNGSGTGNAGNVTISAGGAATNGFISVGGNIDIHNHGAGMGGVINFTSTHDTISTQGIFTCIDVGSGIGNGGNVTMTAAGAININGTMQTFSPGTGTAGNVNLTSSNASISTGEIDAFQSGTGTTGTAGNVSMSANSFITINGNQIEAYNNGTGPGGNITLTTTTGSISSDQISTFTGGAGTAGNVVISTGGGLQLSALIATNSTTGAGGSVTITNSDAVDTFYIGSATGNNYINGDINAAGNSAGGFINLKTASNAIVSGTVSADSGSSGTGGKIQFTYLIPGAGAVNVQNDGTISAVNTGTNTLGIVGFNGGSSNTVTITGTGTISAGQYVNVGNLDPATLAIQSPFTVVSPFTGTFTNTNGNISITQNSISGTLQVSGAAPLTPTPSGGSSTAISSGLTPQQRLFFELNYLSLLQSLQQQANTKLFEQIGTKIATDYTPWTTYWRVPLIYPPLQGAISVNKFSEAGQALFAASEFNANELTALSTNGVVFGPKSGNDFLDLVKGFVLFMPNRNIQVQTREGVAYIPKGATAWVMETGNDAAIYDLHDSLHTGAIRVTVNNKELTLAPGKELLLTKNDTAEFAALNPGKEFGYRNVGSRELGAGIKAYVCDFSIVHGLTNVPVIHNLLASKDPAQRKAAHTMLKNAAILADLTGYPEYQH